MPDADEVEQLLDGMVDMVLAHKPTDDRKGTQRKKQAKNPKSKTIAKSKRGLSKRVLGHPSENRG